MPVAMLVDNPNGSQELYEALSAEIKLDRPLGGSVHVAGPGPSGGWRVIEVWESVEEASRFMKERFLPALEAVGFAGPSPKPEFWPVHACLTAISDGSTDELGSP